MRSVTNTWGGKPTSNIWKMFLKVLKVHDNTSWGCANIKVPQRFMLTLIGKVWRMCSKSHGLKDPNSMSFSPSLFSLSPSLILFYLKKVGFKYMTTLNVVSIFKIPMIILRNINWQTIMIMVCNACYRCNELLIWKVPC